MILTQEQLNIINYEMSTNKVISIQAFAGTGKSTTMKHLIIKNSDKKILYLSFNNVLANDMKKRLLHCENVDSMTIHAFALQEMKTLLNYNIETGKLPDNEISNVLNLNMDVSKLKIIKDKLNQFCNSSKYIVTDKQIKLLWNYINSKKNLPLSHDIYLKMFQLSKRVINYDIIIVDEAQDVTPCILSLIMNQKNAVRIFIGDIHQQIYSFRYVCDPFFSIKNYVDEEFSLTETFRFGKTLANMTSKFLSFFKKETNYIHSSRIHDTNIHHFESLDALPRNTVVICRTNKSLFKIVYNLVMQSNKNIFVLGKDINIDKEKNITNILLNIKNSENFPFQTNNKLNIFNNYDDVKSHFTKIDNRKWLQRLSFFEEYGYSLIEFWIKLDKCIVDRNEADIIISTTHQTKGMEFDNVCLSNDYIVFKFNDEGKIRCQVWDYETYNLIYVAITRAKHNLYINKELSKWVTNLKII